MKVSPYPFLASAPILFGDSILPNSINTLISALYRISVNQVKSGMIEYYIASSLLTAIRSLC